MYRPTATSRRIACCGTAIVSLGSLVSMVFGAPTLGAPMPLASGYPISGSVSQGPVEVPLGYNSGCVGGVGEAEDGEPVCADVGLTGGLDVHQIPMLTPGVIHVRVSAPSQFVKASDDGVSGVVTQMTPSEAIIAFKGHLLSGSLATIGVNYNGADYVFVFKPTDAVTIVGASCWRSEARVTVLAQATGTLSLDVRRSPDGPVARASRKVTRGRRRTFHVRLAAVGAGRSRRCLVEATLRNQSGSEHVTELWL